MRRHDTYDHGIIARESADCAGAHAEEVGTPTKTTTTKADLR
jgi:hypothetical protein